MESITLSIRDELRIESNLDVDPDGYTSGADDQREEKENSYNLSPDNNSSLALNSRSKRNVPTPISYREPSLAAKIRKGHKFFQHKFNS